MTGYVSEAGFGSQPPKFSSLSKFNSFFNDDDKLEFMNIPNFDTNNVHLIKIVHSMKKIAPPTSYCCCCCF